MQLLGWARPSSCNPNVSHSHSIDHSYDFTNFNSRSYCHGWLRVLLCCPRAARRGGASLFSLGAVRARSSPRHGRGGVRVRARRLLPSLCAPLFSKCHRHGRRSVGRAADHCSLRLALRLNVGLRTVHSPPLLVRSPLLCQPSPSLPAGVTARCEYTRAVCIDHCSIRTANHRRTHALRPHSAHPHASRRGVLSASHQPRAPLIAPLLRRTAAPTSTITPNPAMAHPASMQPTLATAGLDAPAASAFPSARCPAQAAWEARARSLPDLFLPADGSPSRGFMDRRTAGAGAGVSLDAERAAASFDVQELMHLLYGGPQVRPTKTSHSAAFACKTTTAATNFPRTSSLFYFLCARLCRPLSPDPRNSPVVASCRP